MVTEKNNIINENIEKKLTSLKNCLSSNAPLLVAFSGGIDSSVLAYMAHETLGEQMLAVRVNTGTMSPDEQDGGERFCAEHGIPFKTIDVNMLGDETFVANDGLRCYYCKSRIFRTLQEWAAANGYAAVCDGTNVTDTGKNRPGLKAITEQKVLSPFLEAGMTTEDIVALGHELKILAPGKESNSCMATRIVTGQRITVDKMEIIDKAEKILKTYGFTYIRARLEEVKVDDETVSECSNAAASNNNQSVTMGEPVCRWFGISHVGQNYKLGFLVAKGQEDRLKEIVFSQEFEKKMATFL